MAETRTQAYTQKSPIKGVGPAARRLVTAGFLMLAGFGAMAGPGSDKDGKRIKKASRTEMRAAARVEKATVDSLWKANPTEADVLDKMAHHRAMLDYKRDTLLTLQLQSPIPGLSFEQILQEKVAKGKVNGVFGLRYHPIQERVKFHYGEDVATPAGTPIMAMLDGVVTDIHTNRKDGTIIEITSTDPKTGAEIKQRYIHMVADKKLKVNDVVKAKDQIATVGKAGSTGGTGSTGDHGHFEMWVNGVPQNISYAFEHGGRLDVLKDEDMTKPSLHPDVRTSVFADNYGETFRKDRPNIFKRIFGSKKSNSFAKNEMVNSAKEFEAKKNHYFVRFLRAKQQNAPATMAAAKDTTALTPVSAQDDLGPRRRSFAGFKPLFASLTAFSPQQTVLASASPSSLPQDKDESQLPGSVDKIHDHDRRKLMPVNEEVSAGDGGNGDDPDEALPTQQIELPEQPVKFVTASGYVGPYLETPVDEEVSAEEKAVEIETTRERLDATAGTPIVSAIEGEIVKKGYSPFNGGHVTVRDGDTEVTYKNVKVAAEVGDDVLAGDTLGTSGTRFFSAGLFRPGSGDNAQIKVKIEAPKGDSVALPTVEKSVELPATDNLADKLQEISKALNEKALADLGQIKLEPIALENLPPRDSLMADALTDTVAETSVAQAKQVSQTQSRDNTAEEVAEAIRRQTEIANERLARGDTSKAKKSADKKKDAKDDSFPVWPVAAGVGVLALGYGAYRLNKRKKDGNKNDKPQIGSKLSSLAFVAAAALGGSSDKPAQDKVAATTEQVNGQNIEAAFKDNLQHITKRQKKGLEGKTVKVAGQDVVIDDAMLGLMDQVYGKNASRYAHKAMRKDGFGARSSIAKVIKRDFDLNKEAIVTATHVGSTPVQSMRPGFTMPERGGLKGPMQFVEQAEMTKPNFVIVPQKDEPIDEATMARIMEASKKPFAQWVREAHNMPQPA